MAPQATAGKLWSLWRPRCAPRKLEDEGEDVCSVEDADPEPEAEAASDVRHEGQPCAGEPAPHHLTHAKVNQTT